MDNSIINFNFALPSEVAEEYRAIGDAMGRSNKLRWAVATAALLTFLEKNPDDQKKLLQRVVGARHFVGALTDMIREAKSGGELQKMTVDPGEVDVSEPDPPAAPAAESSATPQKQRAPKPGHAKGRAAPPESK